MKKVKNTIPVIDICALAGTGQLHSDIIAEPFASYLAVHPNLYLPHRHSFYHLVFFTQGAGYHTIDFEKFPVVPGQVYFMSPGQVHSWNFKGEVDGYVINFSGDLFSGVFGTGQYLEMFPFFQGVASDGVIDLAPQVAAEAKAVIEKIVHEVHAPGSQSLDLIRAYFIQLFIAVSRTVAGKIHEGSMPQKQLVLRNFRKLVDSHYSEIRLPKEYAAMLYITPNHLNALCQDLVGKSAGEIIRERILLEAKRLLVNADLSMSEISGGLNFTDSSYFSKFFKKYTGVSPEEFRRNAFVGE